MLTRNVNGIEYDIDINKRNETYLESDFYNKCESTGINDILYAIYREKNTYTLFMISGTYVNFELYRPA